MSQTTAIAYLPDFSPKGTVDNSTSRTTELRMLFDQLRQLMDCIKIPDTSGNCRYCLQTRSLNRQPLQGFHHTLHRPQSGSFPVFPEIGFGSSSVNNRRKSRIDKKSILIVRLRMLSFQERFHNPEPSDIRNFYSSIIHKLNGLFTIILLQ